MTTTIYREFEFAACDGKWSSDGHLRRDVLEKKAININFRGSEAISFMCGDHPMIALMQALQLKVITSAQYASLMSLYMDVDDFFFGNVVLEKSTGKIMTNMYAPPMVQVGRKQVLYDLGSTGGMFAAECIYYTEKKIWKKRRYKGFSASSIRCKVSSAVQYAYRRDPFSGGKVYKAIWGRNGIEFNNIPLANDFTKNRYCISLQETLKIIHNRYLEIMNMRQNAQINPAASLSKAGQPQQKKLDDKAPKANGDNGQQMTMSRVINYARLFSD